MALNANCVANVTTAGNDANAGWFDTSSGDTAGGANDRAFSNSPAIIDGSTISASVHTTTTQATLVGFTVTSALRGNVLRISGGTATAGYYRITATDAVNNRVTVDASMGSSGATITGRIGGAFASPGQAGASGGAGGIVRARGSFTIGGGTANTAGNRFDFPTNNMIFEGYTSTYGDGGFVTLLAGANSIAPLVGATAARTGCFVVNAITNGNGFTGVTGVSTPNLSNAINCIAVNCAVGVSTGNLNPAVRCYAESCTLGFSGHQVDCVAKSCIQGFSYGGQGAHVDCIAWGCTTGFLMSSSQANSCIRCIAYGGTTGFSLQSNAGSSFERCIAYGQSSKGFSGTVQSFAFIANAANGTNDMTVTTLTADPFTNAAGGDFSLNNTAGGGAVLRALNFAMPGISTTRYPFGGWYVPSTGTPNIFRGSLVR